MGYEDNKCPKCGSTNIVEGKSNSYMKIQPLNKLYSSQSDIYVQFCKDCGYVISMRVGNPDIF